MYTVTAPQDTCREPWGAQGVFVCVFSSGSEVRVRVHKFRDFQRAGITSVSPHLLVLSTFIPDPKTFSNQILSPKSEIQLY